METRARTLVVSAAVMLAALLLAGGAGASEKDGALEERLLEASEGLQMPGSESDSHWWFVSYSGERGLPTVERMSYITGCSGYPEGGMARFDFDATFDTLSRVEPWMDEGQRDSAHGFGKLSKVFHREYGDELAVYRCETGQYGQVEIYFVGAQEEGLSGLMTINTET